MQKAFENAVISLKYKYLTNRTVTFDVNMIPFPRPELTTIDVIGKSTFFLFLHVFLFADPQL